MPYQDRHPGEGEIVQSAALPDPATRVQDEPNSARNIQIVIAVGLVVAIIVAVFGSY